MYILMTPKKFKAETLEVIDKAVVIVEEYKKRNMPLTVRQIHYQFVSRDWSENTPEVYSRLKRILSDARRAAIIPFDMIEDRTRNIETNLHFGSPYRAMQSLPRWYDVDMWDNQPYRIFVLIEKDAMEGVFLPTCRRYDVPLLSCRGYPSDSVMYTLSQKLLQAQQYNQKPIIVQASDHDPSGLNMTDDIETRLRLFMGGDENEENYYDGEYGLEVIRLALTYDQVLEYNPPPNFAKEKDPRFKEYQKIYGDDSYEMDAVSPDEYERLLTEFINGYRDELRWDSRKLELEEQRQQVQDVADRWFTIRNMIDRGDLPLPSKGS